jgi:hypothetical protein
MANRCYCGTKLDDAIYSSGNDGFCSFTCKYEYCDNDEKMDKEVASVIEIMKEDYPEAHDFDAHGATLRLYADITDKDDNIIATISERQLTRYWNLMEGF